MDYSHYTQAEGRARGFLRYVPAIVVFSAFSGFIALAWYAYNNGSQSLREEDLLVVEAEKTPMKEKPLDPGGMKFPNQDKTIFENFSASSGQPARVERVMPGPEEPMTDAVSAPAEATGWVNQKLAQEQAAENGNAPALEKVEAPVAPADVAPSAPMQPVDKRSVQDTGIRTYAAPPSLTKTDIPPSEGAEVTLHTDSVQEVKAVPVATDAKPAAKPAAEAAKPKAVATGGSGKAKVQLGAYRSEKEAQDAFAKLQKKFPELAGRKPSVVKAEVAGKGVFYRLRVTGLADARALCQSLSAKGQACIPVSE